MRAGLCSAALQGAHSSIAHSSHTSVDTAESHTLHGSASADDDDAVAAIAGDAAAACVYVAAAPVVLLLLLPSETRWCARKAVLLCTWRSHKPVTHKDNSHCAQCTSAGWVAHSWQVVDVVAL